MRVHDHVELGCVFCGEDQPHELLYPSEQMKASRCEICGRVLVFSGPLQEEHAVDLFRRVLRLPVKVGREFSERPLPPLAWPARVVRKPLLVLKEAQTVGSFAKCGGGGGSVRH